MFGIESIERLMLYYPTRYPTGYWNTDHRSPCSVQDIFLKARDGTKIHAWLLPQANSRHVILYFHGNAGHIADRYDWGCLLTQIPANVLMLDYRGYGRSEGAPSEEGIYQDAEAAWQWLTSEGGFKPEEIILYGKSLGGGPASELARRYQAAGLILQSTFTSIPDMAKKIFSWIPRFIVQTQFATNEKLPQIDTPTLVIHSRADELIPFEMSERNARAAKNLHKHLIFDGYGHNDLVAGKGAEIVRAIGDLVDH